MSYQFLRASVPWVSLAVLAGCAKETGPELGRLTGVVTLDGEPVEMAILEFVPASESEYKAVSYAVTDKDGRYEAEFRNGDKGVPVGERRVRIRSDFGTTWKGKMYENKEIFPAKYSGRSELTVSVVAGENAHDFSCKTK